MKQRRRGVGHRWIAFAAAVAATSISVGQPAASGADAGTVTAVAGRAVGYSSNVSHFGGPATARGPAGTTGCDAKTSTACSPSVTLPPSGGRLPATDTDGATSKYGPAVLFESTSMELSTQGTTGDAGTVTSSASATAVGPGPFSAEAASSTCTASGTGVSGSAAVDNGRLVTKTDPATGEAVATEAIPAAPAANSAYTGTLDHVGDRFKAVVNEQIANPDGSITVNALHLYLLGPTAVGELIVGQSVCGVTSTATPDAPSGTATPAARMGAGAVSPARVAPLTAAPAVATPAVAAPTQTAATGPGAFGYVSSVGLFGGAPATRPCANPPTNTTDCRARPSVTLPAAGSPTPITDTVPTADARYGPGIIFTSGPITVSTQGTPASSTSKVDIQNVNTSQQEVFTASGLSSTCTGSTGSTTVTGGTLRTSEGTNLDSETDDTTVPIPASPPPNTTFNGKIETVGDDYRIVFNEQIVRDGSITVNAAHIYLLGPTAIGELTVGQSRCGANAVSTNPPGTTPGATTTTTRPSGTAATANNSATGANPGMATTGFGGLRLLLLATTFLVLGTAASAGGARLRWSARARHPADAGP